MAVFRYGQYIPRLNFPDLLGFDPDSVGLNFFYLVFSGAILVCPTAARMGAKPSGKFRRGMY